MEASLHLPMDMACYGGVERFNETETFDFGSDTPLDLDVYHPNGDRRRIRSWWQVVAELRRGHSAIQGPAPLDVRFAESHVLAFRRLLRAAELRTLGRRSQPGAAQPAGRHIPSAVELHVARVCHRERERGREHQRWPRRTPQSLELLDVPDYGAVVLEG
jgi:hypothetical protein